MEIKPNIENKNLEQNVVSDGFDVDQRAVDDFRFKQGENKEYSPDDRISVNDSDRLTLEQKEQLKDETGWSDQIIDNIRCSEEARLYIDAGLKEVVVNDRPCLIRSDINPKEINDDGLTNKERMELGLSPLKDGRPIELHHVGQNNDSPLAELTHSEHQSNTLILHDLSIDSRIDRKEFDSIRPSHWESRGNDLGENI